MPRLIDSLDRSRAIAHGVSRRIAESGLTPPSMRAVAGACGMSPSGIIDQFGGRDRMLEVTGIVLGRGHELLGYETLWVREHERWMARTTLFPALDRDADDDVLDTAIALVDGLNARVCDLHEPMPLARARELLAAREAAWVRPAA